MSGFTPHLTFTDDEWRNFPYYRPGKGVGPKVVRRTREASLVILGQIPNYRLLSLGGVFTPIIAQG